MYIYLNKYVHLIQDVDSRIAIKLKITPATSYSGIPPEFGIHDGIGLSECDVKQPYHCFIFQTSPNTYWNLEV